MPFLDGLVIVLCESSNKQQLQILFQQALKQGATVSVGFSPSRPSHIVCPEAWDVPRACRYLSLPGNRLPPGAWLVNYNWLSDCLLTRKHVTPRRPGLRSPLALGDSGGKLIAKYACQRKTTDAGNLNGPPTDVLKAAADYYHNMGDEMRSLAYQQSYASVKASPVEITSGKQAREQLWYISDKTAKRIDEFLKTGRVKQFDQMMDANYRIIDMFNKVLWAGPKTSARWFALGCRSLSDVVERDSKITDIQKIGIRYYDELTAGIKRTEVEQVEKIVREVCAEIGSDVIMQICGGYRRGNQNIKDIDLLFTRVSGYEGLLDDLVSRLTARGLLTHTCYYVKPSEGNASSLHERYLNGNTGLDLFDKWLGVYRLNPKSNHYRLDLIVVPYECWAYGVLGWSGSTLFERSLRQYAENELGMHLSNHGLTIKATGQSIPAKTEEEIFAALKLEYRAPHERCC